MLPFSHVTTHKTRCLQLQGEDHPAVEDPAAEAGAVAASDLQAVVGPWAAAVVWTVRMVRPVLREEEVAAAVAVDFGITWIVVATFVTAAVAVVGVHRLRLAVPEAEWDLGDRARARSEEGGVAVVALAPHPEAPAEGVAAAVDLVQDLDRALVALVPTAAATITACTAATVVTAVAPAVRLRRITSETATAIREITSDTTEISAAAGEAEEDNRWVETHRSTIHFPHTAAAEGEGEALDPLGPAHHPDRIIHSHSNRNISNRIDMGMAATAASGTIPTEIILTEVEVVVAAAAAVVLALRHNSPTRIRALRHHSVKTKARIRVSMVDLLDPVGDREAHCPRPREEPLIMRQGWVVEEEGAAAVSGPLGPITMPPSGLELHRHRYPLDRCISKSKARPWHPRGHVQKTLFPKLPHRLLQLAKSRALKNPSRRQNRQRRRNRRSPRYRPGHPPRLRRSHRPNLWHKCACLIYERKWSSGMRRC